MLTVERFAAVCAATRWHVRRPLDLICIHSEREVSGRQPRATLNPFTVLAAAAAWERFLSDLVGAVKYRTRWSLPGQLTRRKLTRCTALPNRSHSACPERR
jgi:hypothetical protein